MSSNNCHPTISVDNDFRCKANQMAQNRDQEKATARLQANTHKRTEGDSDCGSCGDYNLKAQH